MFSFWIDDGRGCCCTRFDRAISNIERDIELDWASFELIEDPCLACWLDRFVADCCCCKDCLLFPFSLLLSNLDWLLTICRYDWLNTATDLFGWLSIFSSSKDRPLDWSQLDGRQSDSFSVTESFLMQGCPNDFQNKHLQCLQSTRQSAYSSLSPNFLLK